MLIHTMFDDRYEEDLAEVIASQLGLEFPLFSWPLKINSELCCISLNLVLTETLSKDFSFQHELFVGRTSIASGVAPLFLK